MANASIITKGGTEAMTPSKIQLDVFVVDKETDVERLDDLNVRLMWQVRVCAEWAG